MDFLSFQTELIFWLLVAGFECRTLSRYRAIGWLKK